MNNITLNFDSLISSLYNQLNEADISLTNSTAGINSQIDPSLVSKYKQNVLIPLRDGQHHNVDDNTLKQAVNDGVLSQNDDGSYAVSDAALAHINNNPQHKDLQNKFQPTQTANKQATINKTQTQAQRSAAAASVKNSTGQSGQSGTAYGANTTAYGA